MKAGGVGSEAHRDRVAPGPAGAVAGDQLDLVAAGPQTGRGRCSRPCPACACPMNQVQALARELVRAVVVGLSGERERRVVRLDRAARRAEDRRLRRRAGRAEPLRGGGRLAEAVVHCHPQARIARTREVVGRARSPRPRWVPRQICSNVLHVVGRVLHRREQRVPVGVARGGPAELRVALCGSAVCRGAARQSARSRSRARASRTGCRRGRSRRSPPRRAGSRRRATGRAAGRRRGTCVAIIATSATTWPAPSTPTSR